MHFIELHVVMWLHFYIISGFCCISSAKFPDWLITTIHDETTLTKNSHGNLKLSNGLITREFSTYPGFTTIDFYSHEKQASILRALNPEAYIGIDTFVYPVGSVLSKIPRGYLNRTAFYESISMDTKSFQYIGYDIKKPEAPFHYQPMRGAPKDIVWPPKGVRLDVYFQAPSSAPELHQHLSVCVHYEMYDGIPAMSKWVTITGDNAVQNKVNVSVYSVEVLSVNQQWTHSDTYDGPYNDYKWLYIETDQSHGTEVKWTVDPTTKNIPGSFQPMVNATYDTSNGIPVPLILLNANGFVSFRVHELAIGSSDEIRRGLSRNKLMRLLAPQTQENPIFFHLTKTDTPSFKKAIDQLVEVGFEMLIYSFGSGFNFESTNETYINMIKEQVMYANSKGIEVGGYDLIVLDRYSIPFEYQAITKQNKTTGNACMASDWYDYISGQFLMFLDKTGMTMVETDGPYGGGSCASKLHSHHHNFDDSVYKQQLLQGKFFKELRKRNVYINQPDSFWYQGGSKTGLGYNENQYSLPRWEDISISRQSVFDRIYNMLPTAGWMFLPIVDYHGGGAAAAFEPLSQHLDAYRFGLAQYLGAGVAACYRGYRIYDTDETKALVKYWVSFYKRYRDILISDIVRVRRPDMQSIDAFMHVNYKLESKGLLMVFNPTSERQQMNLTLPLYYTGIRKGAIIENDETAKYYPLDMGWEVELFVDLQPTDLTWFVIRDGGR